MSMSPSVYEAAVAHAREVFPEESVGFVCEGVYVPLHNLADDPATHKDEGCTCRLCTFKAPSSAWVKLKPEMVIHSHPNGPFFPSEADMIGQQSTNVPWAIIPIDEDRAAAAQVWGGDEILPLIGRPFMHGITDCYSLIRDTFRLGREKLAEEGITDEWPFDPVTLPEFPRQDGWWLHEGSDLYKDNFQKAGFVAIPRSEARPGDAFLCSIHSPKMNHAALLVRSDLILHHLPTRVSRREPAGLWARSADMWVRYEPEAARGTA